MRRRWRWQAWQSGSGVFYAFDDRFRHWHGIWHLFVIGGSLMHYIAIAFYVI